MDSTYTNAHNERTLTIESLKTACDSIVKMGQETPKQKASWFTKFMNRHGWHRQYEILVIDKAKFKINFKSR